MIEKNHAQSACDSKYILNLGTQIVLFYYITIKSQGLMNHWKGTAVIKKEPVQQKSGDQTVYNFTVCNTEHVKDPSGASIGKVEFWLDCRWVNPDEAQVRHFKAASVFYLEGPLYDRRFSRADGSKDHGTALEVKEGHWVRYMKDTQAHESDRSSE